jgi:DNA-binding transcriptional LysR family regulator
VPASRPRSWPRATRKVELTQDGQAFYERCKDLLADMDELQSMFQEGGQALRGRLRVDMSSGVARNFIMPRLPQFLQAHPQIALELSSTDRRVDLVREGFDCVLRVGALGDVNLIARPLGGFRMAASARLNGRLKCGNCSNKPAKVIPAQPNVIAPAAVRKK